MILKGLYTAIVSPFNRDGELDLDAFRRLLDMQKNGGVEGVVVCGTTGESPTVNEKEFTALIECAVEQSEGAFQVIAGTGTNNTSTTIERSKLAARHGAQALLLASPAYNKPTQKGLTAHHLAIAEAVDLPQIIYNVPGRTAVNVLPDTVAKLAEHPNIRAVKEACGDINQIMDVIRAVPDGFSVLAGDDAISLATMAAGGQGVVSVVSNQLPAKMNEMVQAALSGDFETARDLCYQMLPLMKANFWESNPIIVKASLYYMGAIENEVRLPLTKMDDKFQSGLKSILKDLELIN